MVSSSKHYAEILADAAIHDLVVGVDRAFRADELRVHGAEIVVQDLAELLDRPESETSDDYPSGVSA